MSAIFPQEIADLAGRHYLTNFDAHSARQAAPEVHALQFTALLLPGMMIGNLFLESGAWQESRRRSQRAKLPAENHEVQPRVASR
jgi:hypothetical protein